MKTLLAVACFSPVPVHVGPMPMELHSQYRRMSPEKHDQYIRQALWFTCKEYRHVGREYLKKRTRVMEDEMGLDQEPLSGNDDIQE